MKREDHLAKVALEGELLEDPDFEVPENDFTNIIAGRGSMA